MVHINIICIGKIKESFFRDAIDEYAKRLSRFCKLEITELNDEKYPINQTPQLKIKSNQKKVLI